MGIAEGRRSAPGDRWSWAKDVGLSVEETPTPALLLDVEVATANADLMGERFRSLSASLRPHVKAHKCAELARLQLDNGAIGVTTATVAEAQAMAAAGVDDVLIANEVVGAASAERLASIAASTRLTAAADDQSNPA